MQKPSVFTIYNNFPFIYDKMNHIITSQKHNDIRIKIYNVILDELTYDTIFIIYGNIEVNQPFPIETYNKNSLQL